MREIPFDQIDNIFLELMKHNECVSTFNMIHKLLHGPRHSNRELLTNQQIACFNFRNNVIKFMSGDKYGKDFMAEYYPDVNFGIKLCILQNMFPMICSSIRVACALVLVNHCSSNKPID